MGMRNDDPDDDDNAGDAPSDGQCVSVRDLDVAKILLVIVATVLDIVKDVV